MKASETHSRQSSSNSASVKAGATGIKLPAVPVLQAQGDIMAAEEFSASGISSTFEQIKKFSPVQNVNTPNVVQRVVLTRSMRKIVEETEFKREGDEAKMRAYLVGRVGADSIDEIIGRIKGEPPAVEAGAGGQNQDSMEGVEPTDTIQEDASKEAADDNEVAINTVDHGDLDNYEEERDDIIQLARKGDTTSGPKDYEASSGTEFKNVSYKLDGQGCINFTNPVAGHTTWENPVKPGSEVDLTNAKVQINKTDRSQHFGIADKLLSVRENNNPQSPAARITEMRRDRWTWHHLPDKYKMVLVDMNVHAKHGHNGGVYIW